MPSLAPSSSYNLNSQIVDENWFPVVQSAKHSKLPTHAVRRMYRVGANGAKLEVWVAPNGSLITSHEALRRFQILRAPNN